MAKTQNANGHQADVISRTGFDPFEMGKFYGHEPMDITATELFREVINRADQYDIVHVHGLYKWCQAIKSTGVKVILQHHGTELSQCKSPLERRIAYKYCDEVIVSTQDLGKILDFEELPYKLVENAADTDHFKPLPHDKSHKALLFDIRYIDTEKVINYLEDKCPWEYEIVDRELVGVNYKRMPHILNRYLRYIDVKIYPWLEEPGSLF